MKILHVEGGRNFYGGAHQILLLIEGLKARGLSNLLACRTGSELAEAARTHAEVYPMTMEGDLDVGMIGRLYRLIRQTRPDVVHLQSRIGADVMGGIAARMAGVAVVHSRRQDNPESRLAVAVKYRLHDRVIAISEGIAQVLLSEGLPPEKLSVARDAVDAAPFLHEPEQDWFRQEFGLATGAPVIGVVAQLIERKGHRFLLEAMPDLLKEFANLQVLFFGKGPMEDDLQAQIARLNLGDHVRFAGFRDDLPRILPCLDLFVHPALREGLGVSLLQASVSGVPIVASRAGGIPEAVRDGVNGLLVPPGDIPALTDAIRRVLRNRELARKMGAAGKELVIREFSVDRMVEDNLRVYRELMQTKASEGTH